MRGAQVPRSLLGLTSELEVQGDRRGWTAVVCRSLGRRCLGWGCRWADQATAQRGELPWAWCGAGSPAQPWQGCRPPGKLAPRRRKARSPRQPVGGVRSAQMFSASQTERSLVNRLSEENKTRKLTLGLQKGWPFPQPQGSRHQQTPLPLKHRHYERRQPACAAPPTLRPAVLKRGLEAAFRLHAVPPRSSPARCLRPAFNYVFFGTRD